MTEQLEMAANTLIFLIVAPPLCGVITIASVLLLRVILRVHRGLKEDK